MTGEPSGAPARAPMRAGRAAAGLALAAGLLAVSGCASAVDPIERLGRKAAERVGTVERQRADVAGDADRDTTFVERAVARLLAGRTP